MKASPGRYSSWIRRAESFVRQLNYLPGMWGISVAIDSPITTDEADGLAERLPFGLPAPLRELYIDGAARCRCRYYWTPGEDYLPQVQEVFPHEMSFYGGPEFIPWTDLRDAHGIHTWWEGADDDVTDEQANAREVWRHTVPFINVGNGDCVALHVNDDPESLPVVYLCHDDPDSPVTNLSESLDQFLSDWEALCYVGPEIWLLNAFLGEGDGRQLDLEQEKVRRLRNIMLGKPKVF